MNIHRLYGEPNEAALTVLQMNFDIADVGVTDSLDALQYNLSKIEIAERDVQKIDDPKMRRSYQDWLHFFRSKTEYLLSQIAASRDLEPHHVEQAQVHR